MKFHQLTQSDHLLTQSTSTDTILQIFKAQPHKQNQVIPELRAYWPLKVQSHVENYMLMLGPKIVILQGMRHNMLKLLHLPHKGIQRTEVQAQQAQPVMYWSNMNANIEQWVTSCTQCPCNLPIMEILCYCMQSWASLGSR